MTETDDTSAPVPEETPVAAAPPQAPPPTQADTLTSTFESAPSAQTPTPTDSSATTHSLQASVPTSAQLNIKDLQGAANAKIQSNKREHLEKIVAFARHKKSITNNDVQILLRVSDATSTRYLLELVKAGRLKRVGKQRRPHYEPA